MEIEQVVKSSQEQATAAWIDFLNQQRLDELTNRLHQQGFNLKDALGELAQLKSFIGDPSHILGSAKSKHGEIAEQMQVAISNARRAIQGLPKEYTFENVARTAPEDYLKNGFQVQSKFYNGLRNTFFGNHALNKHLQTYPEFIKNGGSYDIPKDQYEQLTDLLYTYRNKPSALSTKQYNTAKELDGFCRENGLIPGKNLNPAVVDYRDTQINVASKTVGKEEANIKGEDWKQRKDAYEVSRPTVKEGFKAAGVSAAVEGGLAFCLAVARKRKEKPLQQFTEEDWAEIGLDTTKETVKGGIRGGAVYVLSNFTATPANVATAFVTAAFGVVAYAKQHHRGEISDEDFIVNSEVVCLDAAVSAVSALLGQAVIPVPVLGAVIGNAVGTFLYQLEKDYMGWNEQRLISQHRNNMATLERRLEQRYQALLERIAQEFARFTSIMELVFSTDVNLAFAGSVSLAEHFGVSKERILRTKKEIDIFFLK